MANFGPFLEYAKPDVYATSTVEGETPPATANFRLTTLVADGQEELEYLDLELIRGSSGSVDQEIVNEDVSESWVVDSTNPNNLVLGVQDGTRATFRVRNFPIVDGTGEGLVTNDPRLVQVTVNGLPVVLSSVQGAKGLVTLQIPTQPTDVVRCTYKFHRGDTSFTDDVSDQVDSKQAVLVSPVSEPFEVVATNNRLVLRVDGREAAITFAPGTMTAATVKQTIDSAQIPGLTVSEFADNEGKKHIQLNALVSIEVGNGTANGVFGWFAGTRTSRNAMFRVFQRPIVDGSDSGITTTNPQDVVVKVNDRQVPVASVDGTNGTVTLETPPAPGSSVTVQYFANTWQNTFDYLPFASATSAIRCGISPGRNDFIEGQDFVILNPSPDNAVIHWGASHSVTPNVTTLGAEPIDESQVVGTVVDDRMYLASCEAVVDTATVPAVVSRTEFLLPDIPTTGNGRDTPLGLQLFRSVSNNRNALDTNRPDLVEVRVGRSPSDALRRAPVKVLSVDGANRRITLKDAIAPDQKVYATFWYNRLVDDVYTVSCMTPGPVGVGKYSVFSSLLNANLFQVRFGSKTNLPQTVQWPRGVEQVPDAFHYGGVPVNEQVTITFKQSGVTNAKFTTRNAGPYSFYSPSSATWTTKVNGSDVVTNLAAATNGYLVGNRVPVIQTGVDSGKIDIPANAELKLVLGDGGSSVEVSCPLTAGARTPAEVVKDINDAIDAVVPFDATSPNDLASYVQIGGATGDVVIVIKSYDVPSALPGGFDAQSFVLVQQGVDEIGLTTFQRADASTGAINKPATLLGTKVGPFNITAGLNDVFKIRVNGIEYTVSLPSGSAVTTSDVCTAINAVPGLTGLATEATLGNAGQLRLTTATNTEATSLVILNGSANDVLGFQQNDFANHVKVKAQEVVNALMATANFALGALARVKTVNGQSHVEIESLTTGAATSSIAFVNAVNSAFNPTTGIGITPGVDGATGEDAYDYFTVTSTNPEGSSGEGIPGQTYTDARTGLRFTILPSATGSYTSTGSFTLNVSDTFDVSPSTPTYAFAGLETIVSNLVNVGVNDNAFVQTFNAGGMEPRVGDSYFLSYRYRKQDFSTRLYQNLRTVEANFGRASQSNKVSLGAQLAIVNGAPLVAIKQVRRGANGQVSTREFIEALESLSKPLPGNIKFDVIVPLTSNTEVFGHLTQHCEIESQPQNQSERMGFIGFAAGTTPKTAQMVAKGLRSNRIVAFYPDSAVVTLQDELGQDYEVLADGFQFAAAVAGAVVSPAVDVATPYTRRTIQGIKRIPRVLDRIDTAQTARAGVTILEQLGDTVRIVQGLTTDVSKILTALPTVTQIADYMQQQSRATLDSFIGSKYLNSRLNEVETSMASLLQNSTRAEIIAAYLSSVASMDKKNPLLMHYNSAYQPVLGLLYLMLNFRLLSRA